MCKTRHPPWLCNRIKQTSPLDSQRGVTCMCVCVCVCVCVCLRVTVCVCLRVCVCVVRGDDFLFFFVKCYTNQKWPHTDVRCVCDFLIKNLCVCEKVLLFLIIVRSCNFMGERNYQLRNGPSSKKCIQVSMCRAHAQGGQAARAE